MTNVLDINDYRAPVRLPEALRNAKSWLVWRLVHKTGEPKPRKIPFYTSGVMREGVQGADADRAALVSFEKAVTTCVKGHYTGVGFALMRELNLIALDFDNCVKDELVDPKVLALVQGTYCEFSPSGTGVRAFFHGSVTDRKDHNKKGLHPFAVEFFSAKGYVTVTGNVIPECEMFGFDETIAEVSPAVLALYRERFGEDAERPAIGGADDGNWLITQTPKIGLTVAQVKAGFELLDADCGYEDWLHIGQSLHHEFDGDLDVFTLWNEWSALSDKYPGERAVEAKWASFGKHTGHPLTAAVFIKRVKEAKSHRKYEAVTEWRGKIAQATEEFAIREQLCPQIAKDDLLGEMERESLAKAVCDRLKSIGVQYPIAQCRKMIAEKRKAKPTENAELPTWAEGWVYVTDDDQFYRVDSAEWLSMQSFNARFNREMPVGEDGQLVMTAGWACLNTYGLETVTKGMYLPWAEKATFEFEGVACVNTYRPSSVPKAKNLTPVGKHAICVVLRHIGLLCGGRTTEVDTLLAFLAHQVQKPGVKVRWAPLVKGVEGDGKSLIGTLLAAVMGRANVRNVSPKVLGTDFTGWAEGSALAVLEEIKLTGHNRHDILNALKPFVTNDSVEIHRKGRDTYDAVNTTNYIAFTNHVDALPLTDTDRRWWIIFTPFATRDQLEAAVVSHFGCAGLGAYFDELHAAINLHRAELRRWLLDYPIPESFKPNSAAPETEEKALMVAMSTTDDEQVVREVIAEGGQGISDTVLSSSCLSNTLVMMDTDVSLATTSLHRTLTKIGYTKVPKRLKWNGSAHTAWVRGLINCEPGFLRKKLDETLGKDTVVHQSTSLIEDFFN